MTGRAMGTRTARKLALFYGLEQTPGELARLSEHEVLRLPTVGRRSLEAFVDWLKSHGLELDRGNGPPIPLPKGRTWYDQPWRTPPLLGAAAERHYHERMGGGIRRP